MWYVITMTAFNLSNKTYYANKLTVRAELASSSKESQI